MPFYSDNLVFMDQPVFPLLGKGFCEIDLRIKAENARLHKEGKAYANDNEGGL